MLRENPRPSDDFTTSQVPSAAAIPWKTGTSFGLRDAWAVGIVGPYVLGVWIGNFDGTPNANFIGREAAGPLFFQIVDALGARGDLARGDRSSASESEEDQGLRALRSASRAVLRPFQRDAFHSGKSPIATCSIHRGVPIDVRVRFSRVPRQRRRGRRRASYEFWPSDLLKLFRSAGLARKMPPPFDPACRKFAGAGMAPTISSPSRGIVYSTAADGGTEIPFAAVTDADSRVVYWFVDDQLVGTSPSGESFMWKARPGSFLVRAIDQQGRAVAEQLRVIAASN